MMIVKIGLSCTYSTFERHHDFHNIGIPISDIVLQHDSRYVSESFLPFTCHLESSKPSRLHFNIQSAIPPIRPFSPPPLNDVFLFSLLRNGPLSLSLIYHAKSLSESVSVRLKPLPSHSNRLPRYTMSQSSALKSTIASIKCSPLPGQIVNDFASDKRAFAPCTALDSPGSLFSLSPLSILYQELQP